MRPLAVSDLSTSQLDELHIEASEFHPNSMTPPFLGELHLDMLGEWSDLEIEDMLYSISESNLSLGCSVHVDSPGHPDRVSYALEMMSSGHFSGLTLYGDAYCPWYIRRSR